MKLFLVLVSVIISWWHYAFDERFLPQDYSFLGLDGEVTKLRQQNDTLYELKCYSYKPCVDRLGKRFKILSSAIKDNITVLKLERLDSIPLTTDPFPATRYSVLVLKDVGQKQLGYLPLRQGLTKGQIDTLQAASSSFKESFFLTFFSDAALNDFNSLKRITTKKEAEEILSGIKDLKYKTLVEKYAKAKIPDMYNSRITAELLNKVCLEKSYNPLGASKAIDSLLKPQNK